MTVTDTFDDFPTSDILHVTVQSDETFYEEGLETLERLERNEVTEKPDTFSVPSVKVLFETFTPQTVQLLETITEHEPDSIRETARLVDRDVKNVHGELAELQRQGVIEFAQEGRAKRPVFPYEELVISVPFADTGIPDTASAPP